MKQKLEVEVELQQDTLKSRERKCLLFHGRLDSVNGVGVNKLIKNGAILVTSPSDIIDEIPEFQGLEKRIIKRNNLVKKEYRKIYEILDEIPIGIDEIAIKTQNSVKATSNLLSLMELEDLIDEIPGAGYVKKYKD